ncbi:MAG: DnaA N-terminal domain-containing protein, partial [Polaromonas sp.]
MSEVSVSGHTDDLWQLCVDHLAQELPEQQFNTWIRPLVVVIAADLSKATVQVGNRFKLDWVRAQYAARIAALLELVSGQRIPIELALAPREAATRSEPLVRKFDSAAGITEQASTVAAAEDAAGSAFKNRLNSALTFDTLIEGTANRMGRAAALH